MKQSGFLQIEVRRHIFLILPYISLENPRTYKKWVEIKKPNVRKLGTPIFYCLKTVSSSVSSFTKFFCARVSSVTLLYILFIKFDNRFTSGDIEIYRRSRLTSCTLARRVSN